MNVKEKVEINGEILKQAREEKGYKQDDLAKAIFSTRQSISNWENGKKTPTLENVKRLAEILEIPVNELIANSEKSELVLNTEELSDSNIIDYTLVYDKTTQSRFKDFNYKKIIKIVVLLVLIILLIYLCSSIRKFVILSNLKNKMLQYENIDNYLYVKTYYEINNEKEIKSYNEAILYRDGTSITKRHADDAIDIIYVKDDEQKIIHENTKTYENLKVDAGFENNLSTNIYSNLINKSNITNIINVFRLNFKVKYKSNYYILENSNKDYHIIENITENGELKEINTYNYQNGNYQKITYEVNTNCVTEQDMKINLDGYELIK